MDKFFKKMDKFECMMIASEILRGADREIFLKTYRIIEIDNEKLADKLEEIIKYYSNFSQVKIQKFTLPSQIKQEIFETIAKSKYDFL